MCVPFGLGSSKLCRPVGICSTSTVLRVDLSPLSTSQVVGLAKKGVKQVVCVWGQAWYVCIVPAVLEACGSFLNSRSLGPFFQLPCGIEV